MKQAILCRQRQSDEGTFGVLKVYDNGTLLYSCFTGELPDRDNKPQISCIPPGRYTCQPWHSKRFPNHYNVMRVPNREAILIHEGNFCGDTALGYKSNVLGCILVGKSLGTISGQQAVLSSKVAMNALREVLGKDVFSLDIKEDL